MAITAETAKQSILELPVLMRIVNENQYCILRGIVNSSDTITYLKDPKAVIPFTLSFNTPFWTVRKVGKLWRMIVDYH